MTDPIDWFKLENEIAIVEAETKLGIIHRNGIPWFDAPAPAKHHAHWVQTSGYIRGNAVRIERCPCGAIRNQGESWLLLDEPRVAENESQVMKPQMRDGQETPKKRKWRLW